MTVPNPRISRADQSSLNDLSFHWDTAYTTGFDGDTWSATPLNDPTVVLTAENAEQLRHLIRSDYHGNDRRNWRQPR